MPNTEGDITGLLQDGNFENEIGYFTKNASTLTISSVAYKYWVSNNVFYDNNSATGYTITQAS